jgi:hypothetical protein
VKRFGRIVLNGLTVLSLVLALGVAGSWVRSYWRREIIWFASTDGMTARCVDVAKGRALFGIEQADVNVYGWPGRRGFNYRADGPIDAPKLSFAYMGFG